MALAVGSDKVLRHRKPVQSDATRPVSEAGLEAIGDDFQEFWADKLKERPGEASAFRRPYATSPSLAFRHSRRSWFGSGTLLPQGREAGRLCGRSQ